MTAPCALRGVRELVRRHVGVRADGIDLELRPAADGVHRHSYEVRAGRLRVTGTDPVAIAAGLARFAKQQCGVSASWDDERWLDLPAHLDDVAEVEHSTELEHRYYLNFVTYGYTAAFWDWNRWEREIDWMARKRTRLRSSGRRLSSASKARKPRRTFLDGSSRSTRTISFGRPARSSRPESSLRRSATCGPRAKWASESGSMEIG